MLFEKTVRKNIRLDGYDYSNSGCYFVTICVKNKHEMLGKVVGGDALCLPYLELSEYGLVVKHEIENMPAIRKECIIDKYAIMPNQLCVSARIMCRYADFGLRMNSVSAWLTSLFEGERISGCLPIVLSPINETKPIYTSCIKRPVR